jgi:thioredoxin 1
MKTLNKSEFEKQIIQNKGVAVVDFFAEWCGPCKMMSPIFEEVAKEVKDVTFGKINVDENQESASEYGVMSIPTLIIFKDGEEVQRFTGVQQKEDFIKKIKAQL